MSLFSSRQLFLLPPLGPFLCPPLTPWPIQYLYVGQGITQRFLHQRAPFPGGTGELISAVAFSLNPNIAPLLAGWIHSQSSFQYFHPNPQMIILNFSAESSPWQSCLPHARIMKTRTSPGFLKLYPQMEMSGPREPNNCSITAVIYTNFSETITNRCHAVTHQDF